jgi:hypothetical protein
MTSALAPVPDDADAPVSVLLLRLSNTSLRAYRAQHRAEFTYEDWCSLLTLLNHICERLASQAHQKATPCVGGGLTLLRVVK